ncbi:hypothetical protein FB45DRAFT_201282 [Roridomyces roridus]|uniref:Uncharacterized protein n=1 Tax=Roridomyces roridus TaxID=1738132 RepID=A0AAD7CFL9_9AGAR|nr:hypothetical protein FB45DRAFT_201282 [Roridomyces roridus]
MDMSTDSKYQTNLLDRDSEMHHMMKGLDSYEGDSGPMSFPPGRSKPSTPGPRPVSSLGTHRLSYNATRPLSQASTSHGHDSYHDQQHDRERDWNKPHPKGRTPLEKHHSHSHDPTHSRSHSPTVTMNGHSRTRTQSGGSVHSVSADDGASSRGTSRSSQSDYRERINEQDKERNAEKEHGWNRPQGARSTSTRSVHSPMERTRKLSHPVRPGSSQSLTSPAALSRRHSGSFSQTSSDEEVRHEIEHERERNWGAPIQRWHPHPLPSHHGHSRSSSPLPPSPSTSTSNPRARAESLKTRGTPKGDSPVHRDLSRPTAASASKAHTTTPSHPQARPRSLLSLSNPRPSSYPARPNSPLPPPLDDKSEKTRSVERDRRHSRTLSSPSPSPASRPASRISHIPVPVRSPRTKTLNGHAKSPSVSHGSDPFLQPQITVSESEMSEPENHNMTNGSRAEDPFIDTDEDDKPPEDRTPTLDTIKIPPIEQPDPYLVPQQVPPSDDEEEVFQKALAVAPPPSPPPSPPTATTAAPAEPQVTPTTILGLSTPPKRPSFHASRLEFQTPSPPHGLPELPGPPSPDEEDTETERLSTPPLRFNALDMTSTKTPRPPGAWMATPAPVPRTQSLPAPSTDDSDSQLENGLATPTASLSRASSLPTQTPRPPGGWVATPTPRKSILKVRFDPQPSQLELSATEEESSVNGHSEELSSLAGGLPTPVEEEEEMARPQTPELPVKLSPVKSPRRSPIRIVDEYGRPDKSPKGRKRKGIRVVDAMGQEVAEPEDDAGVLSPKEAVRAVREGVNDLVQGFNEMDLSDEFNILSDVDHIRELDNTSRASREVRDALMHRNAQLRGSMQRSKSDSETKRIYSTSRLPRVWLWTFIIILSQAIFILLLYRAQKTSARELFLKTYYDPFYANLHIYEGHDYLTFARTSPSLASLVHTLREEGLRAFTTNLVEATRILFLDWRQDAWRKWGTDEMRPRWPPT